MKEKFYYLRKVIGRSFHKCGVVYLIEEGGCNFKSRGVALCNDIDRFIKNANPIVEDKIGGIQIARGRALRALIRMKNTGKIKRKEALEKVQGLSIEYKSEFNPMLNRFEENILKDKEENFLQDGEFRSIE